MGFRQPFTVHTDPANPGIVGHGRVLPRQRLQRRQPLAGRHLRVEPDQQAGQPRLAVLRGRQLAAQHRCSAGTTPTNATTGQQYDCSLAQMPSDIRYAPAGQTAGRADLRRSGHAARPGREGDDLEEVRAPRRPEHGRLRRPQRRRHAADHRPDLPLPRGHRQAGRVPALLRRLVADQQPRLQRRLLEGSPAPQGQQRDAAGQRLAAVQRRRQPARRQLRPRHRHAVRPRRPALHGALLGRLLPLDTSAPTRTRS